VDEDTNNPGVEDVLLQDVASSGQFCLFYVVHSIIDYCRRIIIKHINIKQLNAVIVKYKNVVDYFQSCLI